MNMDMFSALSPQLVQFLISNFALSMFVLAALFMLLHRLVTRGRVSEFEIIYRWLSVFAVAGTCFYAAAMHVMYPDVAGGVVGWTFSPIQIQAAIANVGVGLVALLSFRASCGFRLASVIGTTCWLWGNASIQICQIVQMHTLSLTNLAGLDTSLLIAIVTPLLLMTCVRKLKNA